MPGYYACNGNLLSANLQITAWDHMSGILAGTYTFSSLAASCTASYTFTGTGSYAQGFTITPSAWVSTSANTCNSPAVGLVGSFTSSSMTAMTGRISTVTTGTASCTNFQFSLSGTVPKCINDGVCESGEGFSCPDCTAYDNGLQVCGNVLLTLSHVTSS